MLSVGSSDGELVIFRIPKPIMSQDGISYPGTVQNVQQFSIQNVHDFSISCLKWSINGQKLFSGDKSGRIVASVIDFFSNSVSAKFFKGDAKTNITLAPLFIPKQKNSSSLYFFIEHDVKAL